MYSEWTKWKRTTQRTNFILVTERTYPRINCFGWLASGLEWILIRKFTQSTVNFNHLSNLAGYFRLRKRREPKGTIDHQIREGPSLHPSAYVIYYRFEIQQNREDNNKIYIMCFILGTVQELDTYYISLNGLIYRFYIKINYILVFQLLFPWFELLFVGGCASVCKVFEGFGSKCYVFSACA